MNDRQDPAGQKCFMCPIQRVFLLALCLSWVATSASAQLTWSANSFTLSHPQLGITTGKPMAVYDETRGRILWLDHYVGQASSLTAWEFDGWRWQVTSVQDLPIDDECLADDPRSGRKVMFGSSGTRIWDPVARHWDLITPAHSPPLDSRAVMALLPGTGTVQLNPNGETWVWNGADWSLVVTAHSPPVRYSAGMALDVTGNRLLLAGGAPATDTWTFDGSDWTYACPFPFNRFSASGVGMATDTARHQVVMYGGNIFGYWNVTWLWSGTSWSQAAPNHSPPAGPVDGMVWDPVAHRIILITNLGFPVPEDSTWSWDGTDWTQLNLNPGGAQVVTPPPRAYHLLAYDGQRAKTVLYGGFGGQNANTALTDTWESAGRLWEQRASSASVPPPAARNAGALLRSTGALCYLPGRDFGLSVTYNQLWQWSGSGWTVLPLSAAAITPDHQVLGSLLSSQLGWVLVRLVTTGGATSQQLQILVPSSGLVQPMSVPGGPTPRIGSTMVQSNSPQTQTNKVWLFGGSDSTNYNNDLWSLSDTGIGGNLAWSLVPPAGGSQVPSSRKFAAATYHEGQNRIFLMGGQSQALVSLGDTWSFDLATRVWTQVTGSGPPPRFSAAMTYDASIDRIVLTGGYDGTTVFDDIWECDGTTWTQRATPGKPTPRNNASLVYDRTNHRSVLFGGYDGAAVHNDTWSYDGTTWSPVVGTGVIPPPRYAHNACYDEAHGAMVVFGGSDLASPLGGTFHLSSTGDWSPGAFGPAPRMNAAMVYTILQGQPCSLLVGGYQAGQLGDIWRYDLPANSWVQLASGPPARDLHAMAWDRLRNQVVLFGGRSAGGAPLDDTWELNLSNSQWALRSPVHRPPARWNHTMEFDQSHGRTVVVGGYRAGIGFLNDIWEWDGTDWLPRTAETVGPVGHEDAAMAYDSDRARLMLFGGYDGTAVRGELWELHARIDLAGRGNTAHPEGLRFYSQPVLGQPLKLGFANPQGLGFYTIGYGPVQQPLLQVGAPLCEPGNMYATLVSVVVFATAEPNVSWNVPNTPLILGVTLVFQGFSLQPANCWRAADALHVHF